jgi:hypothetical protein
MQIAGSLANPAHRQVVGQFVDWELIERRRSEYPAIGRAFDRESLKDGFEQPPSYCHYMAWRLGTCKTEGPFVRLEELLLHAESLPNWRHERPLLVSPEFADYWSLVWQLQVAEYLVTVGSEVQWARSGPDLSVLVGDERWFVECYTPRKSFGLLEFLMKLLRSIDSAICSRYDLCMPFQLPHGTDRERFLDTLFAPFLNPSYVTDAKNAARKKYPVVLYRHPDSSLRVYVKGDDVDAYDPGVIPKSVGSPEGYLKVALREAAKAKRESNALERHRPNLVAVNYLLSADYQLARSLRRPADSLLDFEVDPTIDAVAISVVGIDERLTREKLKVLRSSHSGVYRIGELEIVA